MTRCLCCGKEFTGSVSETERQSGWHNRCIRSFFGTSVLPDIDVDEDVLISLVRQSTEKGITIPGVQKKLSLHLSKGQRQKKPRLTLVDYAAGYILKPQTEEYPHLPEFEYLAMSMAREVGIKTVPFALVEQGGSFAYITRRIDRIQDSRGEWAMLAMEDFCQLDGRLTQDKYKGSYERCGKIIRQYSFRSKLDMTELFLRVVFSFLIGNSDMHLKNFSLVETGSGSGSYVLSEAYDLLPVNVILSEDPEQLALTLNGKKNRVTRRDFLDFAKNCSMDEAIASRMMDRLLSRTERLLALCGESYLPEGNKQELGALIKERASILLS